MARLSFLMKLPIDMSDKTLSRKEAEKFLYSHTSLELQIHWLLVLYSLAHSMHLYGRVVIFVRLINAVNSYDVHKPVGHVLLIPYTEEIALQLTV